MFSKLTQKIKQAAAKRKQSIPKPSSQKGQVAIVLLLITAIALIFLAVTYNYSKVSNVKTLVTIASNTGASSLASGMTSYAHRLSEEQLGGRRKRCGWTGLLIYAILTGGLILVFNELGAEGLAILGAAMMVFGGPLLFAIYASLVLLNPFMALGYLQIRADSRLTTAWNKAFSNNLSISEQFMEGALLSSIQRAVSDRVEVPDVNDLDQDLAFGFTGGLPNDYLSRFSVYYNLRVSRIPPNTAVADVRRFLDALYELVYEHTDGWGLSDPWDDQCPGPHECCYSRSAGPPPPPVPSVCNPCCVPTNVDIDGSGEILSVKPDCCDCVSNGSCAGNETYECGVSTTCSLMSPYSSISPIPAPPSSYPFVYDPLYDNQDNGFLSFREQLGRDDEHEFYFKNINNVNTITQTPHLSGNERYQLNDATGFFVASNPLLPTTTIADKGSGIFPFLYRITDYGIDLDLTHVNLTNPPPVLPPLTPLQFPDNPLQIHWCDPRGPYGPLPLNVPYDLKQLNVLLEDPTDPTRLIHDISFCVQGADLSDVFPKPATDPPTAVDRVKTPDGLLEAADTVCAQNMLAFPPITTTPANSLDDGFWRRGAERFCSPVWPYNIDCPQHNPGTACLAPPTPGDPDPDPDAGCSCGENASATPDLYQDDVLDDIIYGLDDFIIWATAIIDAGGTDPAALANNFDTWYPAAAEWIEHYNPAPGGVRPCAECDPDNAGGLWIMLEEIQEILRRLESWRDESFEATAAAPAGCSEVWCVPPAGCPLVQADESPTFDANSNGVNGDMSDIIACLDHNATFRGGNAQRFQSCFDLCSVAYTTADFTASNIACATGTLPRSLVPGFDPNAFVPAIEPNIDIYNNCNPAFCLGNGWLNCGDLGVCGCGDAACIATQLKIAQASCGERLPGEFVPNMEQSMKEAVNQVQKFSKRRDFLETTLAELNRVIGIFQVAETKFRNFLEGPAEALVNVVAAQNQANDEKLPFHIIYGWQDPEINLNTDDGNWHIVKVEARMPGKCDNACHGNSQAPQGSAHGFPRIKTYTKKWGLKRCYKLRDESGHVKFRVTRFDESNEHSGLVFPNGMPLWDFKFFHPSRYKADVYNLKNSPTLTDTCSNVILPDNQYDPNITGKTALIDLYKGAFMLENLIVGGANDNKDCWTRVHSILASGVTSETCAKYRWSGGMQFTFVPCEPF